MSDLDVLTGAIASRLRNLAEVRRLYPPQKQLLGLPVTGAGVITALAADDTVVARMQDDTLHLHITLAVNSAAAAAPVAAGAVAAVIHEELDHASIGPRQITVRVASVD